MKKIVEENENEGLEKLLGETVTLFCSNYFYNGELIGVNSTCALLKDPKIIYETGKWDDKEWKNLQSMNMENLYIQKSSIEAFGKTK